MPTTHLSDRILAEIVRIGFDRLPREACGVLLPFPRHDTPESQVVELPNRSNRTDEYKIWGSDIRIALEQWAEGASDQARNSIAIWHTHPQGNVGPSAGDMGERMAGVSYLVVALDREGHSGTATWF